MSSLCGLPFLVEYSAREDRSIIPRREKIAIPLFSPKAAKSGSSQPWAAPGKGGWGYFLLLQLHCQSLSAVGCQFLA